MHDRNSHGKPIDQLVADFETHLEQGLTQQEARDRLAEARRQRTLRASAPGFWALLWDQFNNYLVIILVIAALVSLLLGEWVDSIAIMVIVMLNAVVGVIQESKAEQALAALKKMAAPQRAGDPRRPSGHGPGPRDRRRRHRPARSRQLRSGGRPPLRELQPQGRGSLAHRRIGARRQGPRGGARPGDPTGRPQEHRLHGHAHHLRARQGPRHLHGDEHADRPHRADDPVLRGRGHAAPEEARAPGQGPRHRVPRDLRHRLHLRPLPRHAHLRRGEHRPARAIWRPSARTSSTSS